MFLFAEMYQILYPLCKNTYFLLYKHHNHHVIIKYSYK